MYYTRCRRTWGESIRRDTLGEVVTVDPSVSPEYLANSFRKMSRSAWGISTISCSDQRNLEFFLRNHVPDICQKPMAFDGQEKGLGHDVDK